MARNKSEVLPHSELPDRFHKRVYLFIRSMIIYKDEGGYDQTPMEAVVAFRAHKRSFTLEEERGFLALPLGVREDLERHYRAIVRAEKDAA